MNPTAVWITIASVLIAATSCSKKQPNENPDRPDEGKSKASPLSGVPEAPASPSPPKNAYAEKNWKLDEPPDEWETRFEAAATVDEKIQILGEKETSGPENLPNLIRRSLRHGDERLRLEAVQRAPSLVTVPDEAVDVLSGAVFDPSSEVRAYAMEMAREQYPETTLKIYANTIKADEFDVKKTTAVELGRFSTKPAFEILMEGLADPDPAFVDHVNNEIFLLVNKRFESRRDAQTWWGSVAEKYDDRLNYSAE